MSAEPPLCPQALVMTTFTLLALVLASRRWLNHILMHVFVYPFAVPLPLLSSGLWATSD